MKTLARLAARKRREIVREETRVEHHDKEVLPEDLRAGIEEIRKAIPDIYSQIEALKNQRVEGGGDGEELQGVYSAMKNLTELIQQLGEAKKQIAVQGNDTESRVTQLDSDVKALHRAFRKMVSAVSDLGAMVKSLDDTEKTEAA